MFHFGFSYVGLLFLIMLFVPNIIWAKNKPADYDKYVGNENKFLLLLERAGEVTTSALALIFSDFNIRPFTLWSLWLIAAFICMVLYELYWIRYFRSYKTMADMYSSFAGFPVAGASLPCIAFFMLGIYGSNIFMIVSAFILSVGHIGIHIMHRNEVIPKKKKKPVIAILKILIAIPVTLILLFTASVIAVRNKNWIDSCVKTSSGINETAYIELGGQEQYISIRGSDINNPVIVYIHGGPGSPDSPIMPLFTDPLIDDYTVICWDQRGCGRTYYHNADTDPLNKTVSFEQALQDTDELVDYVRERFGQDKVIIMGHSFGSIVGAMYVQEHSDKVLAFVGIGQCVCISDSDELAYQDAISKVTANSEEETALINAYNAYHDSNSLEDYFVLRQLTTKYHPNPGAADTILIALFSPYTGVNDVRWVLEESTLDRYYELEGSLMDMLTAFDIYDYPLTYDVPMYFISGEYDYTCNWTLAEAYCNDITAPDKAFVCIPGTGHGPQYDAPEEFGSVVKSLLEGNV